MMSSMMGLMTIMDARMEQEPQEAILLPITVTTGQGKTLTTMEEMATTQRQ